MNKNVYLQFYVFIILGADTNNGNFEKNSCVLNELKIVEFPDKPRRLVKYSVAVKIEDMENNERFIRIISNQSIWKIQWSLSRIVSTDKNGKAFLKSTKWMRGHSFNSTPDQAMLTLYGGLVPLSVVFKSRWVLEVSLSSKPKIMVRKKFIWSPDPLQFSGGREREVFISRRLINIKLYNPTKFLMEHEKKTVSTIFSWKCQPEIPHLNTTTSTPNWVIPLEFIQPRSTFFVQVNVSWFVNHNNHILSQLGYQLIKLNYKNLSQHFISKRSQTGQAVTFKAYFDWESYKLPNISLTIVDNKKSVISKQTELSYNCTSKDNREACNNLIYGYCTATNESPPWAKSGTNKDRNFVVPEHFFKDGETPVFSVYKGNLTFGMYIAGPYQYEKNQTVTCKKTEPCYPDKDCTISLEGAEKLKNFIWEMPKNWTIVKWELKDETRSLFIPAYSFLLSHNTNYDEPVSFKVTNKEIDKTITCQVILKNTNPLLQKVECIPSIVGPQENQENQENQTCLKGYACPYANSTCTVFVSKESQNQSKKFEWIIPTELNFITSSDKSITIPPNKLKLGEKVTFGIKAVAKDNKFSWPLKAVEIEMKTCENLTLEWTPKPPDGSLNPWRAYNFTCKLNQCDKCKGPIEIFYKDMAYNITKDAILDTLSVSSDNTSVIIPSYSFGEEDNGFLMCESGGTAAFIPLKFGFKDRPKLTINCITNCRDCDPQEEVRLRVECDGDCTELMYVWWLKTKDKDYRLDKCVLSGNRSDEVILPANLLLTQNNVIHTVVVHLKQNASYYTSLPLNCIKKVPVFKVTCSPVDCDSTNEISWDCHQRQFIYVDCYANCIHVSNITFEMSKPPKKNTQTNKWNLTICEDSYSPGDIVTVTISNNDAVSKKVRKTFKCEEPSPDFYINCSYNCDINNKSDPRLPVELYAECNKNCDLIKEYTWHWTEYPKNPTSLPTTNFTKSEDKCRHYHIKADTFKHRQNTNRNYVIVSAKVPGHNITREITLKFQEPETTIYITCIENCDVSDPRNDVKLKVTCWESFKCQGQRFTWDIVKYPVGFQWETCIKLEDKNSIFIIRANCFKETKKPLTIISRNGVRSNASYSLSFKLPPPVLELNCVGKNCGTGANPFQLVQFIVRCIDSCNDRCPYNWILKENENIVKNWTSITTKERKTELHIGGRRFKIGDTVNVTVRACESEKSESVTFGNYTPQIYIYIDKNKIFDPDKSTYLTVKCTLHCDDLSYDWEVERNGGFATQTVPTAGFIIPGGAYSPGTVVTFCVTVFVSKDCLTAEYRTPYWLGNCEVFPDNGIAAMTNFTITCKNFTDTAEYYVFQEINENDASASGVGDIVKRQTSPLEEEIYIYELHLQSLGVLLLYTTNTTINNIWLASYPQAVLVAVGRDWIFHALLRLLVNVSAINNRENINSTIKNPLSRYKKQSVGEEQKLESIPLLQALNEKLFGDLIDHFMNERDYAKIIQTLSACDTDLVRGASETEVKHYRKHILAILYKIVDFIHPFQTVSFLWKIAKNCKCFTNDAYIAEIISRILVMTMKKIEYDFSMNTSSIYLLSNLKPKVMLDVVNEIFEIVGVLISCNADCWNSLQQRDIVSPDYKLYGTLIANEERELYHLHFFTTQIFVLMKATIPLLKQMQIKNPYLPILVNSSGILLSQQDFKKSNPQRTQYCGISNYHKSYVSIHPVLEDELRASGLELSCSFAAFNLNPFQWDKTAASARLPITWFEMYTGDKRVFSVTHPAEVHFLFNKAKMRDSKPSLSDTFKDVYGIKIINHIGSLIILHVMNDGPTLMKVLFTTKHPYWHEIPKHNLFKVHPHTAKDIQYIAETDEVFLLFFNKYHSQSLLATIRSFTCYSFHETISWTWSKKDCRPRVSENFEHLSCICYNFSLIGASVDTIADTTAIRLRDMLLQYYPMAYHFIVLVAVGLILLVMLILFTIAGIQDSFVKKREVVVFLADNIPGDKYLYLIIITTGWHWNAGTSASVGIQLGEYCSRRHILNHPGLCTKVLQRNNTDCFQIYTDRHLGTIKRVRLWHNSAGPSPTWFCERIIVQEFYSSVYYVFQSKRWLSLVHSKRGYCHASIRLHTEQCVNEIEMSFRDRLKKTWLRTNLELFWFFRCSGDNFSGKERVAVLAVVVFITIFISFFIVRPSENNYASLTDIVVTGIIATLFQVIVSTVFIKSLPKTMQ